MQPGVRSTGGEKGHGGNGIWDCLLLSCLVFRSLLVTTRLAALEPASAAGRTWKTSPGCVLEGGSGRQRARESPGADDAAGTGLAQEGAHRPLLATWLDQSWLWGFWGASIFR